MMGDLPAQYRCPGCEQHPCDCTCDPVDDLERLVREDERINVADIIRCRVLTFGGMNRSSGDRWISRDDVLRLLDEVRGQ
jgi:hypothetical protein